MNFVATSRKLPELVQGNITQKIVNSTNANHQPTRPTSGCFVSGRKYLNDLKKERWLRFQYFLCLWELFCFFRVPYFCSVFCHEVNQCIQQISGAGGTWSGCTLVDQSWMESFWVGFEPWIYYLLLRLVPYCWWFRNPAPVDGRNLDGSKVQKMACEVIAVIGWSVLVYLPSDGSEIRRSPVEVGCLSHYLHGFIHPRWVFSPDFEASTVWLRPVCSPLWNPDWQMLLETSDLILPSWESQGTPPMPTPPRNKASLRDY